MSSAENTMAGGLLQQPQQQKRRWMKYYCEECQAWETREMFEVVKFDRGPPSSSSPSSPAGLGSPSCAVWSWGCAKLIRHGTVQSFRVEHLNNADGHDLAAPDKLDFPTSSPSSAPMMQQHQQQLQQQQQQQQQQQPEVQADQAAVEEVSALQQQSVQHPAQSNGSSQQSKRPKRTVRSAYARESPINSQGGVTSSSPADEVVPDENGASTLHQDGHAAVTAAADTTGPESPAVIDAEHHENGVYKRPRRLTAGDRGLAQALQFEKLKKVPTTPKAVGADEKPSPPSLAAAMKRPKRVTAGLKGMALAAENAKSAPRSFVKKEPKKDAVHQVNVQTRSSTAKKPMKKNKKVGDLY